MLLPRDTYLFAIPYHFRFKIECISLDHNGDPYSGVLIVKSRGREEKGYDVIGFNLLHIWLFVTATTFSLGTEYTPQI